MYGGELCVWYGMSFSSDSSCVDVQDPRDRAVHLCERLEARQTRNGKLQLLIEDNLNRDYAHERNSKPLLIQASAYSNTYLRNREIRTVWSLHIEI